jgi:hypothetical protein
VKSFRITIKCSGGLGAQLFAIGYCIWIKEKTGRDLTIKFIETGISQRSFVVGDLLGTINLKILHVARSMGTVEQPSLISWSSTRKNSIRNFVRQSLRRLLIAMKVYVYSENLSIETLSRIKPWTIYIDGYHADLRIINSVWHQLSDQIVKARPTNFVSTPTIPNLVSIHWRLGDYLNSKANETHGVVHWNSLYEKITEIQAVYEVEKVIVFTDSPEIAKELILSKPLFCSLEVKSSDVWSDMFEMSAASFFIGSHSSISTLVSLAIVNDKETAQAFLPDTWFKNVPHGFEGKERIFHPCEVNPKIQKFRADLI